MQPDNLVFNVPKIDTNADRYLQWLAAFTVAIGRPAEWSVRTDGPAPGWVVGATFLLVKGATQTLKCSTSRNRPGLPLDRRSFPSSHTANAFAGAALVRQEWRAEYPLLSWAGYIPAAVTAALRLSKRRHWPSDVLAGALIGTGAAWMAHRPLAKLSSAHRMGNK